jgi:hypothetical protein
MVNLFDFFYKLLSLEKYLILRTEQRSNGKSSYTVTYHEHEDYLNSNSIFIEKKQDLDLYLEPGEYTYPFTFLLPDKIPSSFEHHYGKIRYTLKGTVDIPWSLNQHTVRSFSVYNDVDLNELNQLNKSLSQPAEVSIEKSVILSFGGPITGYLSVAKCSLNQILYYFSNKNDNNYL